MKISKKIQYLFVIGCCAVIASCTSKGATAHHLVGSTDTAGKQFAKFQFPHKYYDFGVVTDGDTVRHTFSYKNVGTIPLIIHDISTSCGCTVVSWTKAPVNPGDQGYVNVQFYKHHDFGRHTKMVIIKANTRERYSLLTIYALINDTARRPKH
jgi:hypothetical protein